MQEAVIWPDLLIVGVIIVSVIVGIFRGFIQESISLITWIGAIIVGVLFTKALVPFMTFTSVAFIRSLAAFMILFVLTVFLGAVINYFIGKMIRKTPFSAPDRILGSLFGFFRGVVLVSIGVLLAGLTSLTETPTWQSSRTIAHFEKVAIWCKERLPEKYAKSFQFDEDESEAPITEE